MIQQFQQFFNNDFTDQTSFLNEVLFPVFGEDNFEKGYHVLTHDTEIQQKAAEANIEEINHFGTFSILAADIKLFEVVLSDNCQIERSRINIQQLIRRYVETFEGAFMVFHYRNPENRAWRFSYVEKRTSATDATSAKRYTYLFGKDFACRTAAQRFFELYKLQQNITLQDITNAFSVEALTKEFYNELFNWYQWALSENGGFQPITFPNDTSTETDDRKIEEHIIRLVTRLMFVWFIKQKKLVPDDIFAIEPLKRIVKNFDPYSTGNGNYYNGILQNLFFATLNKAIKERAFANDSTNKEEGREHYGIKTLFRNPKGDSWFNISNNEVIQIFSKVPFLNGGLFECLDKEHDNKGKVMYFDGFSRETGRQRRAFIPNCLFFDPNKGIIPLLERYNFTIEENSPFEVQIALDPELLGKVFENLLASYNPETKTTARKQTGSFYTPREIVNYMVDESLIAYLNNCFCQTPEGSNVYRNEITIKRTTPEGSNIAQPDNSVNMSPRSCEEKLRQLLANNSDQNPFDANDTTLLIKALKSAKILDPACGSGAFPMGVLNRMVDLLQKLNDEEASTPYLQKLHLIQNCIYGVDIQTIAVQISKLRFFISLVCEQPRIENAENYGITPLPNLETKFVAANTLIGLEKSFSDKLDLGFSEIRELKDKLWNIRRQHFSARNADEKHQLRKHDEALRKAIEKQIIENASKPDPAKIERLQTEIQTLQTEKEKFVGERWESIVPPEAKQMSMFHNPTPEQQSLKIDKNKEERARIDSLIKEKQKELDKETAKTSQPGFENEAAQLAKWNPYDQNTTSPFFDKDWMFDTKEGFDIVIGNPPYGAKFDSIQKKIFKEAYKNQDYQLESYLLFIEKGISLLNYKGVLSYIIPNTWLSNLMTKKIRKHIFSNTRIIEIVHFNNSVFDAVVDTEILLCERKETIDNQVKITIRENEVSITKFTPQKKFKDSNGMPINVFADESTLIINQKFQNSEILESICKITQGTKPFQVGKGNPKQTQEIVNSKEFVSEYRKDNLYRPLLRGSLMNKYSILWNKNYWIKFGDWLAEPRYSAGFDNEKIIIRQTGDSLIATLDTEKYIVRDNLYTIQLNIKTTNLQYILALLNSKLLNWYYQNILNHEKGEALAQVKRGHLALLPIKIAKNQQPLITLVDRILAAKKADPQANTSALEQQIDNMVYKLYQLTYNEVKVIDPEFALSEAEYAAINLE